MSWARLSRARRTQQRRSETLTRVEPMTSSVRSVGCWYNGTTENLFWAWSRVSYSVALFIRGCSWHWLTTSGMQIFFCIPTLLVTQRNLMQSNYISPKFHVAAKVEHILFFFYQLDLFKFYYYFRVYFFLIKLIIFMLLFFLVFKIWKNKMVVFCYGCAV